MKIDNPSFSVDAASWMRKLITSSRHRQVEVFDLNSLFIPRHFGPKTGIQRPNTNADIETYFGDVNAPVDIVCVDGQAFPTRAELSRIAGLAGEVLDKDGYLTVLGTFLHPARLVNLELRANHIPTQVHTSPDGRNEIYGFPRQALGHIDGINPISRVNLSKLVRRTGD